MTLSQTHTKLTGKVFLFLVFLIFISSTHTFAQEAASTTTVASDEEPSFKDRKAREGFTLNLEDLINKSKKKIEQVEDKLQEQAQRSRNEQRESKAREYYEKAMRLDAEGEFEEAKKLWEKAIKITEHEEMEGYVSTSVKRQRKKDKALKQEEKRRVKRLELERGYTAKEVNKKYNEGVKLYKRKEYVDAKIAFEEVDEMFPDHKATKSYMALISRKIDEDQEGIIQSKLSGEDFNDSKAKARWKKQLAEEEKKRQKKLHDQADATYKEAVRLYKDKQYEKAKDKFKEVEWILPNHKKTIKYLTRIDKDIAKYGVRFTEEDKIKYFRKQIKQTKISGAGEEELLEVVTKERDYSEERRKKEEAEFVYEAAISLFKKKYYAQALEKFNEVDTLYPHFKATDKYIKKIHKQLPDIKNKKAITQKNTDEKYDRLYSPPPGSSDVVAKAIKDRQKELVTQAEVKYQQAIGFYNNHDYSEAQRKFIAVEAIMPGYKATREYLSHIDEDILGYGQTGTEEVAEVEEKQKETKQARSKKKKKRKDRAAVQEEKAAEKIAKAKQIEATKKTKKVKKTEKDKNPVYDQKYKSAKKLYKAKNYRKAKQLLVEVNDIKPGYKSTLKYLSKINKNLEKERVEREHYQQKMATLEEKEKKKAAKQSFREEDIRKTVKGRAVATPQTTREIEVSKRQEEEGPEPIPAPVDVQDLDRSDETYDAVEFTDEENTEYFDENDKIVRKDKRAMKKQQRKIKREVIKENKESMKRLGYVIDDTYDEAKKLYKQKRYAAAKAKFATVERLHPGYRRAASYIERINDRIAVDENKSLARKVKKLEKEERMLRAHDDGKAAAKSTIDEIEKRYLPMSDKEYERKIQKEHAEDDKEKDLAILTRLQRMEEDELVELEERVAFRRERQKKEREIELRKKEEERESKLAAKRAKKEEKEKIRKAKKEREQRRQQYIKDLGYIKEEALRLLKANESAKAKNLMYEYEALLAQADLSEGDRIKLRKDFSKDKEKIQQEFNEHREFEEEVAYKKLVRTDKDRVKLKIKQDRELEALELRIKEEERQLKRERQKEKERLQGLARDKDDPIRENNNSQEAFNKGALVAESIDGSPNVAYRVPESDNVSKENLIVFARESQKLMAEEQKQNEAILKMHKKERVKLEKKKKKEIEQLVKQRQKELKTKRLEINRDLDKKLKKLYKKAVKLHKQGKTEQSNMLFQEVQFLKPGYKSTEKYLTETQKAPRIQTQQSKQDILYARPVVKKKQSRMESIKNALDEFEEKMW